MLSLQPEPHILHVDMDSFFAAVEVRQNQSLVGKPVIVGGDGARGVVASCNYEARYYGIRSAMPSTRAKRLCPHAVFLHGNYALYEQVSKQMHEIFQTFTPLVEGISLDEAFLEVAGARRLFGNSEEIAWKIRNNIWHEMGLRASVGVATTKHIAKLASVAAKPKPSLKGPVGGRGVVIVPHNAVETFFHPMPVRALWGVGPATASRLASIGLTKVGEVAAVDLETLTHLIGKHAAEHLHNLANNIDERDVEVSREAKSIGHEQTYSKDLTTRDEVHTQLMRLSDAVAARLRATHQLARTITAKLRFATFETLTRRITLPQGTANASQIARSCEDLLGEIDLTAGVRLLGVSVSSFETAIEIEQLSFDSQFAPVSTRDDALNEILDQAIDRVRKRFGESAVVPAPLVGPDGVDLLRKGDQQWGPGSSKHSPHRE